MVVLAFHIVEPSYSQSKNTSRLKVAYNQESDNSRYLKGSIIVRVKRYEPLANVPIEISRIDDDNEIMFGNVTTNINGEFIYKLENDIQDWMNPEGVIEFNITYKGNDTIRRASRNVSLILASLEIDFKEDEDEKIVEVNAFRVSPEGHKEAIEDTKIAVYVKSLFSPLLIGTENTDSEGVAKVVLPDDLPGNRKGELMVLVKINEHENYGTISNEAIVNWGIPYTPPEVKQRGLGDTDAPLWMVYTLIVLLSAVWFHYLYVIFMIIKIKVSK